MSDNNNSNNNNTEGKGKKDGKWKKFNNKKNNNYNNNNNNNTSKNTINKTIKFEGKCADIKGSIFDCSTARQADQFVTAKREIEEYIGRTYKYGTDTKITLENLKLYTIPKVDDIEDDAKKSDMYVWQKKIDEYIRRCNTLEDNLRTAYTLIWGQCTDLMRVKIEAS